MNTEELTVSSDMKKTTFIQHVFNFNDETKSDLLNILQYLVICLVPVVVLNKSVAKLIPDVDEEKSSYEMVAEVLGQSALTLLGVFFIHRFVTYFPTYSGKAYASFQVTNIAILFVIIASSFQTRIGSKINILIDRFFDIVEGRTALKADDKKHHEEAAKHQQGQGHRNTMHQASRADVQHMQMPQTQMPVSGATDIHMLERSGHEAQTQSPQNPNTDFNSMFSGPNNPLVNAQQPHMQEGFSEPMAANDFGSGLLNAY
jgi:hypothetical protein